MGLGEEDLEAIAELANPGAVVHFVDFIGHNEQVPTATSKKEEKEQMQYKGKVTEPA